MKLFKQKYYVVLCRKIHGTPTIIRAKQVKNPNIKKYTDKSGTYLVDFKNPTYMSGLKTYAFTDMDDNCPMPLNSIPLLNAKMVDTLIKEANVVSLSNSLRTDSAFTVQMKNMITGGLIGGFGVFSVLMVLIQAGVL